MRKFPDLLPFTRDGKHDKNSRMIGKKPPTHRAYCVLRQGRAAGRWMEAGFASVQEDGGGIRVHLEMLPVTGFDGHILLQPADGQTDAPVPESPGEEEDQPGT